jgi:hypothetical protein
MVKAENSMYIDRWLPFTCAHVGNMGCLEVESGGCGVAGKVKVVVVT